MVGHARPVEQLGREQRAGLSSQPGGERLHEGAVSRVEQRQHPPGVVGGGHDVATDPLGQRADEGRDELLAKARNLPVEPVRGDLVQPVDGDVHGGAVDR